MSFPTLVYKVPGHHFGPNGSTYDYLGVKDEDALAKALAEGWSLTLLDAIGGKSDASDEPEDNAAPSREELEAKATELGIKFDGRTSDAGLLKKIDAALAEGE